MDTVTFELKAASDEGAGTFEGIMSAPVLDRDDEIVDSKAFEPLPEHITIDIDHGLTVEKTVGSGTPYYDVNGLLKVSGTFASTPLGQMTRTLVKEGHIRHMSVAFRGAVRELDEVDGKQHIRKGELINCTITGIPANTATALIAKAATEKVGARNSAKDAERIQNTHDHMVELGATCEGKHAHGITVTNLETGTTAYGNYVIATDGPSGSSSKYVTAEQFSAAKAAHKSADTETPPAPVEQAAPEGAAVEVVRAQVALALAEAELAL